MDEENNPNQNDVIDIPDSSQMGTRFAIGNVNEGHTRRKIKRKRFSFERDEEFQPFEGAEAQATYYLTIEPIDKKPETKNFANLNYKQRLDAIMNVLTEEGKFQYTKRIEMKKWKKRNETVYKIELMLETSSDMTLLLARTILGGCPVKISENLWKNTTQGLIIDHDDNLKGMSNLEILKGATDKKVKDVFRFGQSKVIKISFQGQEKPTHVHFWNDLRFKVLKYYQPPLRCFKCQKYGHKTTSCRNKYACYKCAANYDTKEEHEPKECTNPKHCVNCQGHHDSGDKDCPQQKLEVKWARISQDNNITVQKAKEKYPGGEVPTYAEAVGPGPPLVPQKKLQEETQKLQKQHEETVDKLRKDAETDMKNWRIEQENNMKALQTRIATQEETSANLTQKLDIQNKLIGTLREDLKKKDEQIETLKQQNENLIVENDRLKVNAPKTLSTEIQELKKKIKDLNKQLIDKDEVIRKQKAEDTAKKKSQSGKNR